jgi:polysaccharide export outer membrane protein
MTAMTRALFVAVLVVLALSVVASCGTASAQVSGYQQGPFVQPNVPQPGRQGDAAGPVSTPGQPLPGLSGRQQIYRLGAGDRVKITVFGEPDLTGEFEISSDGVLAFPLVGEVPSGDLSPRELEMRLVALLKDGFLVNPRINVEVINYRPFFILGEVSKPGGYPYVNAMTVITAVALAGGYTPRANRREMTIVRTTNQKREELQGKEDTPLLPGDIITVRERFF